LRTSLLFLWLVWALPLSAALPDLWPSKVEPGELKTRLAVPKNLPKELQPAVRFQKVFAAILNGEPLDDWRADLEALTKADPADPVAQGVSDVARVWQARVWMDDMDGVLKKYYQQHVAFPEKLDGLGNSLPETLRADPWGQPWVYSLRAPQGFARQTNQRYQLGPSRYPQLSTLAAALQNRRPPTASWKITAHDVAGTRSLQFTSATTSALIQPGGAVDGCVLLYIGSNWALLAAPDQLFSVPF